MVAILVITPKTITARISLYNKQFHRHFGFKKMLNFVYFRLDDIHFQSKWRPQYHILIVMISSVIPEILVLLTKVIIRPQICTYPPHCR